jgi:D-alanine-D-alanine ligase-like ATP-grasp enzyme
MKSVSIRAMRGASLYSPEPCMLAVFDLEPTDLAAGHPDAVEYCFNVLISEKVLSTPLHSTLSEHYPPAIAMVESVTLALLAQFELPCRATATFDFTEGSPLFCLAFSGKNLFLIRRVLRLVTQYMNSIDVQRAPDLLDDNAALRATAQAGQLQTLCENASRLSKSRTTQDLQRGLDDGRIPWLSLEQGVDEINRYQIGFGRQQVVMNGSTAHATSHLGVTQARSKSRTVNYLGRLGYPVPRQESALDSAQAVDAAEAIGYPVVIKGDIGALGKRVHVDLRCADEVAEKFALLTQATSPKRMSEASKVVVEEFVAGRIYRVEVMGGRFFDAYDMIPAGVVGDGEHAIRDLVALENEKPARGDKDDPEGSYVRLGLGEEELSVLSKHGMSPDSIPAVGEEVRLRSNSNWSSGGTYQRISGAVHEDNRRMAERIANVLGIDILGLDVISADISRSHLEEPLTVIEVNHGPNVGSYFDVEAGEFVDNAIRIARRLCPDAQYGDVPVIVIKDTPVASDASSRLYRGLAAQLYSPGLANSDGMTLEGKVVAQPQHLNPTELDLALLRDPQVGAAIINRSSESLADHGMGAAGCDIAVLPTTANRVMTTPLWPAGLPTSETDQLLIQSARQTAVVVIDSEEGVELCLANDGDAIFAIFETDLDGANRVASSDRNWIRLFANDSTLCGLEISLRGSDSIELIDVPLATQPLPFAIALGCLVVVGSHTQEPAMALQDALSALTAVPSS